MQITNIQNDTILDIEVQFALENNVWFNATRMVKNFNEKNDTDRRLDHFWETEETKEYIEILKEELHNTDNRGNVESRDLKQIAGFGKTKGTYVHPELGILLARYLSVKFARACDKFIKSKMLNTSASIPEKTLTTAEILELSTKKLAQINSEKINVEKLLEKSKIISGATEYSDKTFAIGEFCTVISSKIEGTSLGTKACYRILRSMLLVGLTSNRPTKKGMEIYLDYRSHDHGYSARIHVDKADQLIKRMIKHLQTNEALNEKLHFPFGEF